MTAKILAVAATLIIGLLGVAVFLRMRRQDPVKELVATTRETGFRTFEGRLADFTYAPLRAERSPASLDNTAVVAAAKGVLSDEKPVSAVGWHALGVAHLLLGQSEEAVTALQRATDLDASSARYRSDLAAARIAVATARENPRELEHAVEDASQALQLDTGYDAARFNRAVALDRLGRASEAIQAYNGYLAVDGRSQWASEARWRRDRLLR